MNLMEMDAVHVFEDVLLKDCVPRTRGDEVALIEEDGVVGVACGEVEIMQNDKDGEACVSTLFEDVHHLLDVPKVEVGAGLVEEENFQV